MPYGADFSSARPGATGLTTAKVFSVGRYISTLADDQTKCLTPAEAALYHAKGISIWLVQEDGANDFQAGANAGAAKAHLAAPKIKALGVPNTRPIYCAVDGALAPSAYQSTYEGIHAYCSAIGHPDALYGPRGFAYWYEKNHGLEWYWETAASSQNGTGPQPKCWKIQQLVSRPDGVALLSGVDYDNLLVPDWGQWPAPTQRLIAGMYWCESVPNTLGSWLCYEGKKAGIPSGAELAVIQAHHIPRKVLTEAQIKDLATVAWMTL